MKGNLDHPLLDAVVITVKWSQVEPEPGQFDFTALKEQVGEWGKAGKGVVINLMLYGQEVDDQITPSWVYQQGVESIWFSGGGQAKGRKVRIPKVWDEYFFKNCLEPLIAEFARNFNGHPDIWYINLSFGHIGNMVTQPSKGGALAVEEAGWTPEKWKNYCLSSVELYQKYFDRTPLMVKSAPLLLRNRKTKYYLNDANEIIGLLGERGVTVVSLGANADPGQMKNIRNRLSPLADSAQAGKIRLGMGDDWPLWVPQDRRDQAPTQGYDDKNLKQILKLIFGGRQKLPITILYLQEPEISASNPNHRDYQKKVYQIIKKARKKLKKIDRKIYGK